MCAIHDFPKMHTDCTQTSPKSPVSVPVSNPMTEAAPVEFFFTPHLEIEVNFHLKSCQRYTRNLSNFTALTLLHPCKSQAHPYKKIPVTHEVTGSLYILSAKSDKRWNFKACEVPKTAVYCCKWGFEGKLPFLPILDYLFRAWATSTAHATVHPTIGLLPIPRNPIISTWAGTEDEPANCASLCIRPMVSVIPY